MKVISIFENHPDCTAHGGAHKGMSYQEDLSDRHERQRLLDGIVASAILKVTNLHSIIKNNTFYGASAIHPRLLAIWYLVESDADYCAAQESGLISDIDNQTRSELRAGGYPAEVIDIVHIRWGSLEDLKRKAQGNMYLYVNTYGAGF